MRTNERPLLAACVAGWCLAAACATANAAGGAPSVCPARPGVAITQIDLFDGPPAEQVQLAPDDEDTGPGTWSVKYVYDAGRTLTIRCHYGADSVDVELVKPVSRCTYSGGHRHPALACK